jgi:hypothetical protein
MIEVMVACGRVCMDIALARESDDPTTYVWRHYKVIRHHSYCRYELDYLQTTDKRVDSSRENPSTI